MNRIAFRHHQGKPEFVVSDPDTVGEVLVIGLRDIQVAHLIPVMSEYLQHRFQEIEEENLRAKRVAHPVA